MAVFAFTDAFVSVNGVDLSDHVRSVSIEAKADELDSTAMSATYRSRIGGLNDWSISIEFNQDFAGSEVDATIFPLLGSTTAIVVRPDSAGQSATNPTYSGSVLVSQYQPVGNAVGELATVSVTWPGAGTLTRTAT